MDKLRYNRFSIFSGILFFYNAYLYISRSNLVVGITFFVVGIIELPYTGRLIEDKFNFRLSGKLRILLIVAALAIAVIFNKYTRF